jgi:hypothetical protein
MTEPHKRPYQHPKYKIAYRVNNGREYEQSLRDRGDITLWISPETISAWRAPMTGKRGAQPIDADIAIDTALALRLLFPPPLRQTEGFLQSVLKLMGLVLPCPDHTTLSRRNATVAIRRQVERAPQGPVSVIVDSASYGAAKREILPGVEHRQSRYLNNRCENSHLPTRQREWRMQRFKSSGHAQRFLSAYGPIAQHFRPRRHLLRAGEYRQEMAHRFEIWQDITGTATA